MTGTTISRDVIDDVMAMSVLEVDRNALRHARNALRHDRNALRHARNALRHDRNALRHARNALRHARDYLVLRDFEHLLDRLAIDFAALRDLRPLF